MTVVEIKGWESWETLIEEGVLEWRGVQQGRKRRVEEHCSGQTKKTDQWTNAVSLPSSDSIIHCPEASCPPEGNDSDLGFIGCRNINANSGNRSLYLHWTKETQRDKDRCTRRHTMHLPSMPFPLWAAPIYMLFILGGNSLYPWIQSKKNVQDTFFFF